MQTFDALDPLIPLTGKILIEASAGTGKTYAIEHVVCRLIVNKIPLSHILITTFTNAGARDLRERIFLNLQTALDNIVKGENALPYLEGAGEEEILSLKNALSLIDHAEIHTIHSFCYKMLSEYAFEAKIEMDAFSLEMHAYREKISLLALDTLRTLQEEGDFSPAQLCQFIDFVKRDHTLFIRKVTSLLENNPLIPPYASYQELQTAFSECLQKFSRELSSPFLEAYLAQYNKMANKEKHLFPHVLKQIEALQKGDLETLLSTKPSIFDLITPENLKKNLKEPISSALLPQLQPIIQEAKDPKILFNRLASKIQKKMEQERIKTPHFLLESMLASLNHPSFLERVQKRFQAVIIDEFQDTDALQWEIFERLFFSHADLFLAVGDPKQSIYGFRGADLAVFELAKNRFSSLYSLSSNYRSDANVIASLNALFSEKHCPGLFTFQEKTSTITYQTIEAKKGTTFVEAGVIFALTEEAKGRSSLWPSEEIEERKFFPFIVSEILRLQKEYAFGLNAFAILVRDRFQAMRLSSYLTDKGIASFSTSTESITTGLAFSLLHLAAKLAIQPKNRNLLKQFLLHPLINAPLEEILQEGDNPHFLHALTSFLSLSETLRKKDLPTFFSSLLSTQFTHLPLMELLAKHQGVYADTMQIIALALNAPKGRIDEIFSTLKRQTPDETPSLRRKPFIEDEGVSIMTSHMSKGLEFPIVFSLGVASRSTHKGDLLLNEEKGERLKKQDLEKLRLLYVALTRPKHLLYIFAALEKNGKEVKIGEASPVELFLTRLCKPNLSYEEMYAQLPHLTLSTCKSVLHPLGVKIEEIPESWETKKPLPPPPPEIVPPLPVPPMPMPGHTYSFSSLPLLKEAPTLFAPKELLLPAGPDTGNAFHLIFEKLIEEGSYASWNEEKIRRFVHKELLSTPLSLYEEEVYDLVKTAFFTPLTTFCLADVPPSHMIQEMEFHYRYKECDTMKGFADLIFSFQGKYYILDWKLNALPDYKKETLDLAMKEHAYDIQASIYREALEKHLSLTSDAPFETLFGGSFYFFLRGKRDGLYHFFPQELSHHERRFLLNPR